MSALHNAFVIFRAARSNIGFEALYPWPLGANSITIEKREEILGYPSDLGIHYYGPRLITMSASRWGETSPLTVGGSPIGGAYRAWIGTARVQPHSCKRSDTTKR